MSLDTQAVRMTADADPRRFPSRDPDGRFLRSSADRNSVCVYKEQSAGKEAETPHPHRQMQFQQGGIPAINPAEGRLSVLVGPEIAVDDGSAQPC